LKDLDASLLDLDKWLPRPLDTGLTSTNPMENITEVIRHSGTPVVSLDDPQDDDFIHLALSDDMYNLSIASVQKAFFGKSSGVLLIQKARDLKHEYTGQQEDATPAIFTARRPEFWNIRPVCNPQIPNPHHFYHCDH
jgi:hypothetical protein